MTARQRGSSIRRVVLKNGDVRWRFRLDLEPGPDGKRRQQTITCRTEAEAIAKQAKSRTEVAVGAYVEPDRRTVGDVLDAFLLARSQRWKPGTAYQAETALRSVREQLGAVAVQRLRREDVDRAIAALRTSGGRSGNGRSARTVRVAIELLRAALDLAVRDGVIHRNVARNVELPKAEQTEATAWSATELRQFLTAAEDEPLVGAFYLLGMGMRRGEVLGVRWSDVDLVAGTVTVRQTRVLVGDQVVTTTPKSARSRRTVPLTPEARRALALTRERTLGTSNVVPIGAGRGADDRLVAIDEAGEPITPWGFRREVLALMATAGVPVIRVHDIRHSVATILLEAGQPPHVVARILGHDPAVLMRTYAHVGDASAAGAVAALGQAIAGG